MTRTTVAKGDGIGPGIMDATLAILKAAGAKFEVDEIAVGKKTHTFIRSSRPSTPRWTS